MCYRYKGTLRYPSTATQKLWNLQHPSTQCHDGDLRCIEEACPSELDIPEKSDKANKPQPSEEVQVKAIDLGTGDSSKTTMIGAGP
jgi:hypothetical protein